MKFISTLALYLLPAAVLAAPAVDKSKDNLFPVSHLLQAIREWDHNDPSRVSDNAKQLLIDADLFKIPLDEFTKRRNAKDPSWADWSSDACSHAADNPFGFPFKPACQRHDFGYRNYQAIHRFDASKRLEIDQQLFTDLDHQCRGYGMIAIDICKELANTYYLAVRAFGGDNGNLGIKRHLDLHNQQLADAVAAALASSRVAILANAGLSFTNATGISLDLELEAGSEQRD